MTPQGPGASRGALWGWRLFDWANSPFPTVIVTFVFSAYFTQAVADNPVEGTAWWSGAITISAVLIAILSPPMGAVADQTGRRKPWLGATTCVMAVAAACLWLVKPEAEWLLLGACLIILANVAFEIGMVFYNAMLPDLAPPERLGRLSGEAWALGYAGGLACLVIALFGFVKADPAPFGLDKAAAEHVRAIAPLVAIWIAVFSIPTFLMTPDRPRTGKPFGLAARDGIRTLKKTMKNVRQHKEIVKFLVARLFYVDGMNTLFTFGGVYAAGTFGMSPEEIIIFGIALNVTAGIGAWLSGMLDDRIGAKHLIMAAIIGMFCAATPLLFVESKLWFWIFGLPLGIFFGPAQTASRSLMARMSPPGQSTEMFGLFALSGKATSFMGPFLVGTVTALTGSQRFGMATIAVLLVIGAVLLLSVKAETRLQPPAPRPIR
jgi:MFS transporter, UMF1 family